MNLKFINRVDSSSIKFRKFIDIAPYNLKNTKAYRIIYILTSQKIKYAIGKALLVSAKNNLLITFNSF
jgi:hypothetical protein